MGVSYKKGTFTKNTGTGTQDVTGVGFQAKALILFTSNQTVETFEEHAMLSYGFSDGTTDCCLVSSTEDNVTTSDTYNNLHNDSIVFIINKTTGAFEARATLNSFASDGFQLNWVTNTTPAAVIHYIAIGGTDITNVKVGTQNVGTTATGNKAYTGVGFQPDFLHVLHNNALPASAYTYNTTVEAEWGFGISAMKATNERWAIVTSSQDAVGTSVSWRREMHDKCFTHIVNSTGAVNLEADFISFDSDGFTWNYTTNAGGNTTNQPFAYLAIKGGLWTVGDSIMPDINASVTTETAGNGTLKGIMLANILSNATGGGVSTNGITIGGSDGTNNGLVSLCDLSGSALMVVTQIQNDNNCNMSMISNATASSSTTLQTGAATFGKNSFTIAYTNTDANIRIHTFWAVSEADTITPTVLFKKGVFLKKATTGTQDICTVGFQPKALIIWGLNINNYFEGFIDHFSVSYGFSDGTTDMVVAAASEDNGVDSDTYGNCYNDAIVMIMDPTIGTNHGIATVNAWLTNGFQLNWSVADTNRLTLHYVAIGGTDITNVKVGSQNITKAGGATGNQAYTGAGFQPDFLLTSNWGNSSVITIASTTASAHAGFGISAMKSTTARWTAEYSFRRCKN